MTDRAKQIADGLQTQLADAEAQCEAIRREIAAGPCREFGHTWKHSGGRNASCCDECQCSIPVYVCEKCGDCDYGDNKEAATKIAECSLENHHG